MPRDNIIIGVPSGDVGSATTFFGCLLPLLRVTPVVDVWNGQGNWSSDAHNEMIAHALDMGERLDYLCFIDSDMIFPTDALARLLAHRADVVGVTYRRRKYPHAIISAPLPSSPPVEVVGGCHEWSAIPAGLMLIDMKVLRAMSYPWFWDTHGESIHDRISPDINFGAKCRAHGFKVFCDYDLSRDVLHQALIPIPFALNGVQRRDDAAS